MALAHSAVGAIVAHTTGALTADFPFASPLANDVAILFTILKTNTLTDTIVGVVGPDGAPFAEIGPTGGYTGGTGTQGGVDTGPVRVQAWLRICTGAEGTGNATATLNTTRVNSSVNGRIVQATKAADAVIAAAAAGGADNTTGTSWAVTFDVDPDIAAGDLLYTCIGNPTDIVPTYTGSAMTATGTTLTEGFVVNPVSGSGNDTGGRIEFWTVTGKASAAATHTITLSGTTTNAAGPEILVRLRETSALPRHRSPNYRR